MLLEDQQVLEHIKRVAIRLQGEKALLLGVHLQEAAVVQTHHLSLQPLLTPQVHGGPTAKNQHTPLISALWFFFLFQFLPTPPSFDIAAQHYESMSEIKTFRVVCGETQIL